MTDTTADSMRPPLDGLVILDFSRILAGPFCTMLLADLGAEVIKIERPGTGDDTRSWGPPFLGEDAAYFLSVNRGKKSIVLDLNEPEDRALARDLAASADVVVENFRRGVMAKFGLDYETLRRTNQGVVYCSIPAFASAEADKPGYDLLMQAASGFMSVTGDNGGEPVKIGAAVLDVITGLFATTGILAALAARGRDGNGQQVTVGLFEASVAALVNQAANYLLGGVVPVARGTSHPSIVPYQTFQASDSTFVLAAGNDKLFRRTAEVIGAPELAEDPRFITNALRVANRDVLVPILQKALLMQPAEFWLARFDAAGVPASLVRSIDDVFDSPEGEAMIQRLADPDRGTLRLVKMPIGLSATPPLAEPARPPLLGEHGDEIREAVQRDQS